MSFREIPDSIHDWKRLRARTRIRWQSRDLTRHGGFAARALISYAVAFTWAAQSLLLSDEFQVVSLRTAANFPGVSAGSLGAFLSLGGASLIGFLLLAALGGYLSWLLLRWGFAARKRWRLVWCAMGTLGMPAPLLWGMSCDYTYRLRENAKEHLLMMAVLAVFGAILGVIAHQVAGRGAAERRAECHADLSAKAK